MKLYLGTDEGLAVFEGQEEEWHPRYVRLEEHRITAVATAGKVLWAGTPSGLWRSLDGGPTWWPSITGKEPCHVRSLAVFHGAAAITLVGAEPASIYLSRDNGESWVESDDVKRLRDEHQWQLPLLRVLSNYAHNTHRKPLIHWMRQIQHQRTLLHQHLPCRNYQPMLYLPPRTKETGKQLN